MNSKIENIIKEGNRCKANLVMMGPTGPTGPAGSTVSVYGGKYNTTSNALSLQENTPVSVALSSTSPLLNITSATDSLIINETGTYKIDYYLSGTLNSDATLTFSATQNDTSLTSTELMKEFKTNIENSFNGSIILNLTAKDKIALNIEASAATQFTPSDGNNAYLNIIKL